MSPSQPSQSVNPRMAALVPCPYCKTPTPYRQGNAFRPFCSERCQLLDLGAWANESFRVAAKPPEEGEFGDDTPPQLH